MRLLSMVSALAAVLAVAAPAHATLVKNAGVAGSTAGFRVPAAGSLLYDQTSNPAGNGVPDQDFESAFDAYDSEAADDFIVSATSGWSVTQVNTVGTTGTAGSATVKVTFSSHNPTGGNGGQPGTALCTYTGLVPTDTTGSFQINLPTACNLPAGHYWLSIQTSQAFATGGQHFWSNRSVQSGAESVWRNPGGGFATSCSAYGAQRVCGVGGGASPDLLFQILGSISATNVPATNNWALGGLGAGLALFGFMAMRRRSRI